MKKLIALVLILAWPAVAWGATKYAVTCGGASSLTYVFGAAPASLNLDITLTLDEPGTFGFGGALIGPAGVTITGRVFGAPAYNAIWLPNNADATYLGQPIGSKLDFGSVETAAGWELPAGSTTVLTLTVTNLPTTPGYYEFRVGDSSDYPPSGGGGVDMDTGWWSNTGSAIAVDSSEPFIIAPLDTPEPATLLLLAGALPLLRRRAA